MAAGGGTFVTQNKVLPGAYINFVSRARALGAMGERGIAAVPWISGWGDGKNVLTVEAEDFQTNCLKILGYSYTDDEMLNLREVFKGASSVKLLRLGEGEKASASIGELTVTALYGGTRGNDIRIVIENDIDNENSFIVTTLIGDDMIEVDSQTVTSAKELLSNDFVSFKTSDESGTLTATAATALQGGTDKEVTGNDYSLFLDKIESEDFTTLLYAGSDAVTKGLFASFTKRLRDDEGCKITCVLHNYTKADFEGVISVKNTIGENGTDMVYWTAGKTAGAEVNESLTNAIYDGEYTPDVTFKKSELKEAVENGEFVFYGDKDSVKVLKDINTFISIASDKNSDFTNNQVIRVLDAIANDTARIFDNYYLGKMQNDEIGRSIFKAELAKYHEELQSLRAITNFELEDIEVKKGVEKGDVVVNEYVEPVGTMEKLYMTCIVE